MKIDKRQRVIDELLRYKKKDLDFIIGLTIAEPKPWPEAARMVELHEAGFDSKTIAEKTGRSVICVEQMIVTKGIDGRVGPQCDRYKGRLFSIDEALAEMPLPCGPDCICDWRPTFDFDKD